MVVVVVFLEIISMRILTDYSYESRSKSYLKTRKKTRLVTVEQLFIEINFRGLVFFGF